MPDTAFARLQATDPTRFLFLEGVSETAAHALSATGFDQVDIRSAALSASELPRHLENIDVLGIRSRTQVTDEIIARAGHLRAIGCFSVGTNQVALDAARGAGIPVFNAPFSNTRSVAELTMAEIIFLFRRTFPRSMAAHAGAWHKSAIGSHEIRGKVLGIVGYGNIGSQVAAMAEALNMAVVYHDITDKLQHGNVRAMDSLDQLLQVSDVVTIHVPDTPATRMMIDDRAIDQMKRGAFLINNARGSVVDVEALARALQSNRLGGAAVDVFPVEPKSPDQPFTSPLQGLDNVILTPHVGGSTCEAQDRIGEEVARRLADYISSGSTVGAVNFPNASLPARPGKVRLTFTHHNNPGALGRFNDLVAGAGFNIIGQQLATEGDLGYVIADCDGDPAHADQVLAEARASEDTINCHHLNPLRETTSMAA
jgi:D-3-phosphoglycerate dehydrogenase